MVTQVVGIRISSREKFLWQTYSKAENYSLGHVISLAVDQFLNTLQIYILDQTISNFVEALRSQLDESSQDTLVTLTFRIKKESLEIWDQFISEHLYTRTILIRQAMQAYFSTKAQIEMKLRRPGSSNLIRETMYNLIHTYGPISSQRIYKIFSLVDRIILRILLVELEEHGRIGLNWGDEYYSYEKHADRAENIIREMDQTQLD
ncbi:MAG: hypothetical protein ACTSYI_08050 [Promethearchaeota archaeon]